jgi:hypothetical protein
VSDGSGDGVSVGLKEGVFGRGAGFGELGRLAHMVMVVMSYLRCSYGKMSECGQKVLRNVKRHTRRRRNWQVSSYRDFFLWRRAFYLCVRKQAQVQVPEVPGMCLNACSHAQ